MFSNFFHYIGGFFLGWGLGANDSANVFGTAVGSRMISWRTAAILTAVFVFIGAMLQGRAGIETLAHDLAKKQEKDQVFVKKSFRHDEKSGAVEAYYQQIDGQTQVAVNVSEPQQNLYDDPDHPQHGKHQFRTAMIMSMAAAITVIIMTLLKLPVSTSQAVVGCIIGVNLVKGCVQWDGLIKVVICWVGTPIGAFLCTIPLYLFFRWLLNKWRPSVLVYDRTMTILLILSGSYGAYALGANNVANVSAVFVSSGAMNVFEAELFGAVSIAIGVVTFSKPVMMTVGSNITKLDAFMAFITVLSFSITVWAYALVGVPVSSTQAIVGSILGFAVIKGAQTVNFKTLGKIAVGWVVTPVFGGVFAALCYFVSNLHYIPE